jgi:hypothetical protein
MALSQNPPGEWIERMRALKTSLQARRAGEVLLRVSVRPQKDYIAFDTGVDLVLRFRNVSDQVVTLLAPEAGSASSPSAVTLEISRSDRDIYAAEFRRSWSQTVFVNNYGDPPVVIPPGGHYDFPVRIPASEVGSPVAGLRVIEVGGTMRPTRLQKGGAWRTVRLAVRPGRVVALPNGFEPLVERPLHSMRTAVETVAPIHLLVATEFVPSERRAEAVAILARALAEGDPSLQRAALGGLSLLRERSVGEPLRPLAAPLVDVLVRTPRRSDVVMLALSTLTGVRLAPDVRLWEDWWRREADRRTKITPRDDSKTP